MVTSGHKHMIRKTGGRGRRLKVTASLYLEPEQASALKMLSQRTRIAQAVYLREAVDLLLAKYKVR